MSNTTILHSLLDARLRSPKRIAVKYIKNGRWQNISWQEYFSSSAKIGAALSELGVITGDRVAIYSSTRYEWALADCGILGLGAVTVPIYQSSIPSEIEHILNNSEAKIIFIENQSLLNRWKEIADKTPAIEKVICLDVTNSTDDNVIQMNRFLEIGENKLKSTPDFFIDSCENRKRDELATIVYTSGTTGVAKGVMLTHTQILSEVEDVFRAVDVSEYDTSLTFLPFAHILGRVEHFAHVHIGFTMGYAETAERIKYNLMDVRPTFLVAVPRFFEKLHNSIIFQAEMTETKKNIFHWAVRIGLKVSDARTQKRYLLLSTLVQYQLAKKLVFSRIYEKLGGRLRFAVSGGAPLNKDIARFFHATNIYLLEGYGLTETTAAIFLNSIYDYRFGTVGKACGDVEVKIADDGEILVRSKKVMIGYYHNEAATREVLSEDGWFATGDIGELTADGFLRITDRKKDLIKTAGGKFIAPQKLEVLLKQNKYISNVLIHGDKRKYVIALITLNWDEIHRFTENKGIKIRDHAQLAKHPAIHELIRNALAETNSQLASFESIKDFNILPEDFTIESGELTPSLKVRRKFCDKKYSVLIDKMFSEETKNQNTPT